MATSLSMLTEPLVIRQALAKDRDMVGLTIDFFEIEWYEAYKSRMRKQTQGGVEVLVDKGNRVAFEDGDLLYLSDDRAILLKMKPCDCVVLRPRSLQEVGTICFEIGNKHVPIFITDDNEVCVAYDAPLYQLLLSGGFELEIEERVLHPLQMIKAYGNKSQK
ncbi:urease accessory protein UreE [Pontibacter qinzhouensis]|uniref:Urease accessory protein UreE n=1 Tax=Pontibacter qinzhouensis TaxID=2603253 RepID=A0A5C8J2Z6_9BACT|nr:urease accessory protein UreE [Pontibacter qinzhouensis]TXK29655.1 urease accessory protein UreE [Pontibacter qinzhouensis]